DGEAGAGGGEVDVIARGRVVVGGGHVLAGGEQVQVVAPLGEGGDHVVGADGADGGDVRVGGGVVDPLRAADARVAAGGGDEDAGGVQRRQLVGVGPLAHRVHVVARAQRHV